MNPIAEFVAFYDAVADAAARKGHRYDEHCTEVGAYKLADPGWCRASIAGTITIHPEGSAERVTFEVFEVPDSKRLGKTVPRSEYMTVPAQLKKDVMRPWMKDRWFGADVAANYMEDTEKSAKIADTLLLYANVLSGCDGPWVDVLLSFLKEGVPTADKGKMPKGLVAIRVAPGQGYDAAYIWEFPGVAEAWEKYYATVVGGYLEAKGRHGIDLVTGEESDCLIEKYFVAQRSSANSSKPAILFGVPEKPAFESYGQSGMGHGSISADTAMKVARAIEMACETKLRIGRQDEPNFYELVYPFSDEDVRPKFGELRGKAVDANRLSEIVYAMKSGDTKPIGIVFDKSVRMVEIGIRSNMGRASVLSCRERDLGDSVLEHDAFADACSSFIGDRYFRARTFMTADDGLRMTDADADAAMDWLYATSAEWAGLDVGYAREPRVPLMLGQVLARRGVEVPDKFAESYIERTACLMAFCLKDKGYKIGRNCEMEYCSEPTYLLGRVFACVEYVQYNGGKQRGVREKMFSAAAAHPKVAADQLFGLYASYDLYQRIDEDMREIVGGNAESFASNMPVTANEEQRLLFYTGYFYQKRRNFTELYLKKKKKGNEETGSGDTNGFDSEQDIEG